MEAFQRRLSIVLPERQSAFLWGARKTGKSTFLHMLAALEPATEGEIRVDGRALAGRSRAELDAYRNRDVGLVFQFHHLLPDQTALANVAMPALIARLSVKEAEARAAAGRRRARQPGRARGTAANTSPNASSARNSGNGSNRRTAALTAPPAAPHGFFTSPAPMAC